MKGQKHEIVEQILSEIPKEYVKNISKMNQRKLIKFIIDGYCRFIYNKLVSGKKFVILNIGRLALVDFRIGAKMNPFTGKPVKARLSKRIKFTPSIKLRKNIRK